MNNKKLIMLALAMTLMLMLSSCENTSTIGKTKGDSATESTVQEGEASDHSKDAGLAEDNAKESTATGNPGADHAEENTKEGSATGNTDAGHAEEKLDTDSTAESITQDSATQEDASELTASNENATEETVLENTPEVIVNDPSKFPPLITLSGKEADHYVTTDYCYIEGDKFYLLLDKDVDLPGDFADNVSKIMDALEEKVGLTFTSASKNPIMGFDPIKMAAIVSCHDPWEEFYFGQKVPIYIIVNHDGTAWTSHALAGYAYIDLLSLYSDEICNKLGRSKEYYKDFVPYDVIAHELTHVLTQRYTSMTSIMTEGSADYFAEETIRSLAQTSESFSKAVDHFEFDYHVDQNVTAQNAETLFYHDFEDQYDQSYAYGHLLCSFLAETYGNSFMHDYIAALQKIGYYYGGAGYAEWPRDPDKKRADEFKKLFGEKVFTDFAAYYEKNHD
ncbi:MAG: hypothetical protein IK081_15885 [Lachnospiraceae bacterium]|nr:hypothetical protein [Lachnospiraceae bacterium]